MTKDGEEFEKWYVDQWGLDSQGRSPCMDWHTTENMQESFEAGLAAGRAEAKPLVEALEFYADKKNYTQISPDFGYSIVKISSDDIEEGWSGSIGFTTKTGGKRARQALAAYRKGPRP